MLQLRSGSVWLRARKASPSLLLITLTIISTIGRLSAGRNGGLGGAFFNTANGINPLVFHKYSLMTPSSSVVGTSAGAQFSPTEHLLSYVPAPLSLSGVPSGASSISPLPIMSALGATGSLASAAATLNPGANIQDVPVTYK